MIDWLIRLTCVKGWTIRKAMGGGGRILRDARFFFCTCKVDFLFLPYGWNFFFSAGETFICHIYTEQQQKFNSSININRLESRWGSFNAMNKTKIYYNNSLCRVPIIINCNPCNGQRIHCLQFLIAPSDSKQLILNNVSMWGAWPPSTALKTFSSNLSSFLYDYVQKYFNIVYSI